ncbi:tetratricopeptide repeat protein [candidate division KSB1 bacterium]|nr:tetratricopeptide repeat protein [candidate division KSB1 bacterium]
MKEKAKKCCYFFAVSFIIIFFVTSASSYGQSSSTYSEKVEELKRLVEQMKSPDITREEHKALEEHYNQLKAEIEKLRQAELAKSSDKDKQNVAKRAYNRGGQLLRKGKYQEALAAYDEAIAGIPDYSVAYHGKGLALKSLRRYLEAEAAYQKAIELDSSNAQAYFALGKLYSAQDMDTKAIAIYDLAIKKNANWEKPYYEKAVLYEKMKEYDKAADILRTVTQLKPDYDRAYYLLGRVLLSSAKYDEAIMAFETTIALSSRNANLSYWGIARANNKKGDFKAALEAAKQAIAAKPNDAMSLFEAGEACKNLGRKQDAIDYFTEAAKNRKWRKSAEYEIKLLTESK